MSQSPLTSILLSKAQEVDVAPDQVSSKRESLLDAYKKLIEAQKYSAPNVRNVENGIMGAAMLANAKSPGIRGYGEGTAQQLKYLLQQDEARKKSNIDQNETFLKQKATDLGFSDSDRELQYKYLKAASDEGYKDDMSRLKELLLVQKLAEDSGTSAGSSTSDPTTLGIPAYAGPDPYAGLDKVGRRQKRLLFDKDVQKAQDEAGDLEKSISSMKRFQELNEASKNNLIGTGPIADLVPNFSANLQDMAAISAEIVPQMRAPNSGSTSNFDAEMFKTATVGTGKDYEVNKNIAQAYIISKQDQMAKADYLETYLAAHGHLVGAEKAWKRYLNDNPIFSLSSTKKKLLFNENRKDWQTYFGASPSGDSEASAGEKGDETELIPEGIDKSLWEHLQPEEKDVILRKRGMK